MAQIVCFGELLLRLTATGHQRLLMSGHLQVFCGGAEANVAVCLSRFGHAARMVSALPDNPLSAHILDELKAQGVDTDMIRSGPGRVGTYYLDPGAVLRPSQITYDRAGSSFAQMDPYAYDWPANLVGSEILHISGITPALGPNAAEACSDAAQTALDLGINVSFDGNYRQALWQNWNGDGPTILRNILAASSIAFINEKDINLICGTDHKTRQAAINYAFATFPKLVWIAATERSQTAANNYHLKGELYTREASWSSAVFEMPNVVDRIGAGDAFAAGILHGLCQELKPQDTVDFATASGVMKHSIAGDWNLTRINEVEAVLATGGLDVRR